MGEGWDQTEKENSIRTRREGAGHGEMIDYLIVFAEEYQFR